MHLIISCSPAENARQYLAITGEAKSPFRKSNQDQTVEKIIVANDLKVKTWEMTLGLSKEGESLVRAIFGINRAAELIEKVLVNAGMITVFFMNREGIEAVKKAIRSIPEVRITDLG